jgi:hypothetical protein
VLNIYYVVDDGQRARIKPKSLAFNFFSNNSGSINCEMKIADEDAPPLTSSSNIINTHILIRAHQRQDNQLIACFLYLDLSKNCHFDSLNFHQGTQAMITLKLKVSRTDISYFLLQHIIVFNPSMM